MAAENTQFITSYQYTTAKQSDKVYKEECMYCYDTPISADGLYVCLSRSWAVCHAHLPMYISKFQKTVFLHLKKNKIENSGDISPPEKKITKLAIGVEGGFDTEKNKVEYEDSNELVLTDNNGTVIQQWQLQDQNIPLVAQLSITSILTHQGALAEEEVKSWEEKRKVSKHAHTLKQLDNGVKVPPSKWKCARCDLTNNLWLNLTDGTILCGRQFFDGSGGNNHAVEYYKETGYPLAVKLGTITQEGGGDVFSYDEDDMVEDPLLINHLKHFGINVAQLQKTDKTMTELEIEKNLSLKYEWDAILESGKKLTPLYGAGYTGMVNLGNSCYMNSLFQVLFSTQEFHDAFVATAEQHYQGLGSNPATDVHAQLSKLGTGLLSGKYSQQENDTPDQLGIRAQSAKSMLGRGHVEFSTNNQQDVQEYFTHVMDLIGKKTNTPLNAIFNLEFEDRVECLSSKKVSYTRRAENFLSLNIPLDAATNKEENNVYETKKKEAEASGEKLDHVVRLNISAQACLQSFAADEIVDSYYSTAIKAKTQAKRRVRFATFPDYLVIQLRKFTFNDDWTPKKLDVSVEMPDEMDLNWLRGEGKQPGEELLPTEEEPPTPEVNAAYLEQLQDMGFHENSCKKALIHTSNAGPEAAMNWLFEHAQDADFTAPYQPDKSSVAVATDDPDPSAIEMLVALGFNPDQAKQALKKNQNNVEAAAEWIFTHPDELMEVDDDTPQTTPQDTPTTLHDGNGKYKLFAFISHMGTSTSCGHYVCHVNKDGRWVIYNDRKVAVSEKPPKDLGYIYFYKRI